ncbi:30S ribosomal protein S3 chloroplastic [Bienertia sinuspersici]
MMGNMGQKINPLGFRLGTTQSHYSLWFSQPKNYSEGLQEDQKIRDCIKNYVQKNTKASSGVEGIARIEIQKRIDLIQIIIHMDFQKLNCVNQKINIAITRIEKPYGHPNILAEFIAGQLKNRVSFRKAMKKAIELTEQADTKGIQIQIAVVSMEKKLHVSNGQER